MQFKLWKRISFKGHQIVNMQEVVQNELVELVGVTTHFEGRRQRGKME